MPFLIELGAAEVPARADILSFLADMSGGHSSVPVYEPHVFHSTPPLADYPEATATIDAIREGELVYREALVADDAEVRAAAAYLLAGLDARAALPSLLAAYEREGNVVVRGTFVLALARLGHTAKPPAPSLEHDLAAAVRSDPDDLASLERLALHEPIDASLLPFASGDVAAIAVRALEAFAGGHDVGTDAIARVLEARLARGERIREHSMMPTDTVSSEPTPVTTPTDEGPSDTALRLLAGALTRRRTVFLPREVGGYVRRGQLDERVRRVLSLTADHWIPLPAPGLPWLTPSRSRMRGRFRDGLASFLPIIM